MSGMEPLAALGLASNVLQMISFVHETASTYARLAQSGTPDWNLSSNTERLIDLTANLQASLGQVIPQSATPDENKLATLAAKCLEGWQGSGCGVEKTAHRSGQTSQARQDRQDSLCLCGIVVRSTIWKRI